MAIEPAHDRVDERGLKIEGRLVAWDPILSANLHEPEKFAIRGPALEWLEGGH
jgi:hypothetical protein